MNAAEIKTVHRAAYALPSLPLAAMYFPVFVFLSEFYADARGVDLAALGWVLLAVRAFDAVSDPLVGHLSDGRGRLGQRKLWLVAATPIVMVATWQLFVPPNGAGIGWFAIWLFILTAGWTLAMTPYFAWGAELSGDYSERGRIAVWRETAGLIGTIGAAVLYGIGESSSGGMRLIAFQVVLLLPVAVCLCWRFVPEPTNFGRSPPKIANVLAILRAQTVFRSLIIAYFINGCANGIAATLFVFFVAYRLGAPDLSGPLLVLYFGAAVLAAPLWSWLVARYSKHRVWCWAMIYAGLIFVWTIALGEGDWRLFAVICVLSGAALGADLALPSAIQADLVDVATAESGAQQTGAFFAIWSVATKLALAVSGAFTLIYLDIVGFDVALQNEAEPLLSLALLYGLGPILLKLVAVIMMWSFPIDRAAQIGLRAKIEGREEAV